MVIPQGLASSCLKLLVSLFEIRNGCQKSLLLELLQPVDVPGACQHKRTKDMVCVCAAYARV